MRNLRLASLASGSKGNSTYITDGVTGILIDCGLTRNKVTTALNKCGLERAPIHAILLTHKHGDHAGNARVLADKLKVPVHMSVGARRSLEDGDARRKERNPKTRSRLTPDRKRIRVLDGPLRIGSLDVEYIDVPHDAPGTVAFRVGSAENNVWAGVITDFGHRTEEIVEFLRGLSIAVLEFNHDVDRLLAAEEYDDLLKERIGNTHMNNEDARDLLIEANPPRLKHLVLGHLSEKTNTPELARRAAQDAVEQLACTGFESPPSLLIGRQRGLSQFVSVDLPPL